ncbi:hypothetical protein AGIG_G9216 [Arapaima gigas]
MLQMMRMKRNRAGDTVQTVTSAHKFSFHYTQQRRLMRPQTQLKAQPCVDGKSLILKIFLQKPHMPGFLVADTLVVIVTFVIAISYLFPHSASMIDCDSRRPQGCTTQSSSCGC